MDLQKYYTREKGKDDKKVTISSISRQIEKTLQARSKTASLPGLNISPSEDPSFTSGLTCDTDEDDDSALLCGAYLDLEPEGDDISLLGYDESLTGVDIYPHGHESLKSSTPTWHTSASNVKHATSLLT